MVSGMATAASVTPATMSVRSHAGWYPRSESGVSRVIRLVIADRPGVHGGPRRRRSRSTRRVGRATPTRSTERGKGRRWRSSGLQGPEASQARIKFPGAHEARGYGTGGTQVTYLRRAADLDPRRKRDAAEDGGRSAGRPAVGRHPPTGPPWPAG